MSPLLTSSAVLYVSPRGQPGLPFRHMRKNSCRATFLLSARDLERSGTQGRHGGRLRRALRLSSALWRVVRRCFQRTAKFFVPLAQTLIVVRVWLAHQVGNLTLPQPQSKPPETLSFARHSLSLAFVQQQTGRGASALSRELIITPMPRHSSW